MCEISMQIANFTMWDKVNMTTGINGRCVGNIGAVGDFPGLCLEVLLSAT